MWRHLLALHCLCLKYSFRHGGRKKRPSYSLFQVRPDLHNEVESLESLLQLVAIYIGAFAIVQLALRFKVHVVYDEAMTTGAGIHFIALTHSSTKTQKYDVMKYEQNVSVKKGLLLCAF